MKLNIDQTNDHLGTLVETVINETERPDGADMIENDDWARQELESEKLFMFACELSLQRCRGDEYDTDEDGVILDALRAMVKIRLTQIAPNGVMA